MKDFSHWACTSAICQIIHNHGNSTQFKTKNHNTTPSQQFHQWNMKTCRQNEIAIWQSLWVRMKEDLWQVCYQKIPILFIRWHVLRMKRIRRSSGRRNQKIPKRRMGRKPKLWIDKPLRRQNDCFIGMEMFNLRNQSKNQFNCSKIAPAEQEYENNVILEELTDASVLGWKLVRLSDNELHPTLSIIASMAMLHIARRNKLRSGQSNGHPLMTTPLPYLLNTIGVIFVHELDTFILVNTQQQQQLR